jgi:hypothetical protein
VPLRAFRSPDSVQVIPYCGNKLVQDRNGIVGPGNRLSRVPAVVRLIATV